MRLLGMLMRLLGMQARAHQLTALVDPHGISMQML